MWVSVRWIWSSLLVGFDQSVERAQADRDVSARAVVGGGFGELVCRLVSLYLAAFCAPDKGHVGLGSGGEETTDFPFDQASSSLTCLGRGGVSYVTDGRLAVVKYPEVHR